VTLLNRASRFLLKFLGLVVSGERFEQRLQLAVHDGFELVEGEADSVVGDAVLREVVSADLLATVAGTDHGFAFLGQRLLLFFHFDFVEAGARFLICDFSSWQLTTVFVGMCVMRTAE
jgi:hypothetical protein